MGNNDSGSAGVVAPGRLVDRLHPRLVNVLTVIGFAAPVIGYFWMLWDYAVNVVVGDQWDDVVVIGHSYSNFVDWSSLWAQHNENRIFFPNLIVLALSRTTHFNIRTEEFVSALMLTAAVTLFIRIHKHRSPSTPWLYYCPVAILTFSIVQYEDTLWGFQLAWYLVLLCLAGTLATLDRRKLNWLGVAVALLLATVGSFSSLQGLLIWPAGLVLLYYRRRPTNVVIIWITSAVVATGLYFSNFHASAATPDKGYGFRHPLATVKFFLFLIGDIVGYRPPATASLGTDVVMILGAVIFVLAITVVLLYGFSRDLDSGIPIGVSLVCVGLLFALVVTMGRVFGGIGAASGSRYTTYTLLTPVGIYLVLLQLSRVRRRSVVMQGIRTTTIRTASWALAVIVIAQVAFGMHFGSHLAYVTYTEKVEAQHVLRNINHEPNGEVQFNLDFFRSAELIRAQARILQEHRLSVFAEPSP